MGTFKHSTTLSEKLANVIKSVNGKIPELELDSDDPDLLEEYENLIQSTEASDKSLRTKLVQDMVVRWNSTLMMLISIFEAHGSIRIVICNDPASKSNYQQELLSEKELNVVEDLIQLLQPFHEITKLLSASEYVTSSIMLPAVTRLSSCLKDFESIHGNNFVNEIAASMRKDLETRTKTYFENPLLVAATFMDPRYRNLKFIASQEKRDKAFTTATTYIKTMSLKISSDSVIVVRPAEITEPAAKKPKKTLNFTLLCEQDSDSDEDCEPATAQETILKELTTYRSTKVKLTDQSCPLKFYQNNQHSLPIMSKLAELVFCPTASSVPSECTFSSGGKLLRKERTRILPVLAEELLILHKNKF